MLTIVNINRAIDRLDVTAFLPADPAATHPMEVARISEQAATAAGRESS